MAEIAGKRSSQRDALPLAARELGGEAILQPGKLDQGEQLGNAHLDRVAVGPPAAGLDIEAEGDVARHRHVIEQGIVLEDETDPAPRRGEGGDVLIAEANQPGIGKIEPGDEAQQGGLAGARRADEGDELAFLQPERNVVERLELGKALGDMFDADRHQCPIAAIWSRWRHSRKLLSASVTSASKARREATAKAATKLYSL